MPKIGMASSAMVMADWLEALKTAAHIGYEAFEISCVFPSADPENVPPASIESARQILAASDMELCVHAPFYEINIAAFRESIREASVRIVKTAIDMCHRLGGTVLVVHCGDYTYEIADATWKNHPALEMQWNYNIEALKRINDDANARGITVCLENIVIGGTSIDRCFDDLLEIRERVGDTLKFTLDTGHARLTEGTAKGIRLLGENIRHIHLTDNFGEKDDHLAVGEGDEDFTPYLDFMRGFQHVITLEVVNIGTDPGVALKAKKAMDELLASHSL